MRRALGLLCCLFLVSQYVSAQNSLFVIDNDGKMEVFTHRTIFFKNPFTITYGEKSSTDNSVSFSFAIESTLAELKSFDQTPTVGVCFARNSTKPTKANGNIELGEYTNLEKSEFSATIKGLDSGMPCYCRVWVMIGEEVFYGDILSITTTGTHDGSHDPNVWNGYAYIDLGLPSKRLWATENIGAGVEGDPGTYFAWGETTNKLGYSRDNYKYGSSSMSKYNNTDGKTELEGDDETATFLRGEYWQIPTADDFQELIDNCTWTWSSRTSSLGWTTYGYTITGPNGKSIFLPAVGYYQTSTSEVGYSGWYWTRILRSDRVTEAYRFWIDKDKNTNLNSYSRFVGMPIRPVIESEKTIWPS